MIYDVVIAGGGPVGLFLACELQLAGVSVLVLEKMADPRSPLKEGWMGMRGLNFPSVEAFYHRGLLDEVRAGALGWMGAGPKAGLELRGTGGAAPTTAPRFAGHFAGIMLDMAKVEQCWNDIRDLNATVMIGFNRRFAERGVTTAVMSSDDGLPELRIGICAVGNEFGARRFNIGNDEIEAVGRAGGCGRNFCAELD